MLTILAIDTSGDFCAAALIRGGKPIACDALSMSRGYVEALASLVQRLNRKTDISFTDLDLIGVTKGPGSFTGVRTGLAAARGFAFVAKCPAIGVSSFSAVAAGAAQDGNVPILVALETRRADYFIQMFNSKAQPLARPAVMDAESVRRLIEEHGPVLAGNAALRLSDQVLFRNTSDVKILPVCSVPTLVSVAGVAEKILHAKGVACDTLSPLYLRAPEAKISPTGGRLKNRSRG